jgi:hypothetical protein
MSVSNLPTYKQIYCNCEMKVLKLYNEISGHVVQVINDQSFVSVYLIYSVSNDNTDLQYMTFP